MKKILKKNPGSNMTETKKITLMGDSCQIVVIIHFKKKTYVINEFLINFKYQTFHN